MLRDIVRLSVPPTVYPSSSTVPRAVYDQIDIGRLYEQQVTSSNDHDMGMLFLTMHFLVTRKPREAFIITCGGDG